MDQEQQQPKKPFYSDRQKTGRRGGFVRYETDPEQERPEKTNGQRGKPPKVFDHGKFGCPEMSNDLLRKFLESETKERTASLEPPPSATDQKGS